LYAKCIEYKICVSGIDAALLAGCFAAFPGNAVPPSKRVEGSKMNGALYFPSCTPQLFLVKVSYFFELWGHTNTVSYPRTPEFLITLLWKLQNVRDWDILSLQWFWVLSLTQYSLWIGSELWTLQWYWGFKLQVLLWIDGC